MSEPRTTVYFDEDIRRKLERLSRHYRRNRSNMLAWLVEQEYARLFGEDAADTDAATDGDALAA